MSWITNIAGKAEELLNKVDQAAATSLNTTLDESDGAINPNASLAKPTTTTSPTTSQTQSYAAGRLSIDSTSSLSNSISVPSNLNKLHSPDAYLSQVSRSSFSSTQSNGGSTKPKKKDQDDELFEFLNSSDNPGESRRSPNGRPKTLVANTKQQHSRNSSSSSLGSRGLKTPEVISVGDANSTPGTPGWYF